MRISLDLQWERVHFSGLSTKSVAGSSSRVYRSNARLSNEVLQAEVELSGAPEAQDSKSSRGSRD